MANKPRRGNHYQPFCFDDSILLQPQPRDRRAPSLVVVHALNVGPKNMSLRASWARTESHLRDARSELPDLPVRREEGGAVEDYEDYLDHNELELALDELEGLASANQTTTHFWFSLRAAASEMSLQRHVDRYSRILEGIQPLFDFECDRTAGTVSFGEEVIPGFVDADRRCSHCDSPRFYHDTFDAYYCAFCNLWLEGACSDPSCDYCKARPPKPMKSKANKAWVDNPLPAASRRLNPDENPLP